MHKNTPLPTTRNTPGALTLGSDPALFIGSQIYRGSVYGAQHPLSIQRVPAVIDLCRALGWLPSAQYRTSPRAKPAALTGFHTQAYVTALMAAEAAQQVSVETRERHGLGTLSNPIFAEMYRRPATAVGGGLLAAELLAGDRSQANVVFNPGGGQHHGMPDRAAGFCFLNEPVLTINRLLAMGLSRIAYVDIDAHHGDGVQAAFEGSAQVRVISIHEAGRWPFTGARTDDGGGAAWNLPVARGFHDIEFDYVLGELILPAVAQFRPDAVFLQCGADALAEDPLARLALSNRCHVSAALQLRALSPRLIISGGGGYNPWSVARCWAGVWGAVAGYDVPDLLPDAAQSVLRKLHWHRKARPDAAQLTTLRDAPRRGPISAELRADVGDLRRRLQA